MMSLLWITSSIIYFCLSLVDDNLDVLFCKSDSRVLDSSGNLVCDISRIGKVF
jgi:hypothetical protein